MHLRAQEGWSSRWTTTLLQCMHTRTVRPGRASRGRGRLLQLGVGLALLAHRVELVAGGRDDLALAVPVALEALGVGAAPVALDLRDGAVDGFDDAVELALVADELVSGGRHRF